MSTKIRAANLNKNKGTKHGQGKPKRGYKGTIINFG
jgi:hypothetical protein